MKSTARMVGAWKGWDTRRRNELRFKALDYFIRMAKEMERGLPALIQYPKDDWGYGTSCVELCLDWGQGYVSRWFNSRTEALDYLIDIAPKCS